MTRLRKLSPALALSFLVFLSCSASLAQTQRPPSFLAEHYDIAATLDPAAQSLSAIAKIEFRKFPARFASNFTRTST
jgi:hypothetical protein